MRREILMPPVTPTMVHGKISRWHVAEGQSVAAGDVLVEIATSTATLEIEAQDEGRVERILVPAGTEGVKVNTPIAVVLADAQRRDALPLAFAALDPHAGSHAEALVAATPMQSPRARTRATAAGHAAAADPTYREALRDAIAGEMRADDKVLLIGVDV